MIKKCKKDRWCEAALGLDPKSKQPHLLRCQNKAVVLYFYKDGVNGFPLCQSCYEKINDDKNDCQR